MFLRINAVRIVVVLSLALGMISIACSKKSDANPSQKTPVVVEPQQDYDEDGYPIDRNRNPGVGTTHVRGDGIEELNIPLREAEAPSFTGQLEMSDEDPYGYPIERRPTAIGSSSIRPDGKEELIIPLRERYFEDAPVMPRVVGP
jgi:hypothetical protein